MPEPITDNHKLSSTEIENRIRDTGTRLRESITDMLDSLPIPPRRPADICKGLGVNKDLASKILMAITQPDPFAAMYLMPGPEALRSLVKAAGRKHIQANLLKPVTQAISDFDYILKHLVGGRSELNAVISALLPEARQRFEMSNKQAMFKAASNLKGFLAECMVETMLLVPAGDQSEYLDVAGITGFVGMRRLKPGIPILTSIGTIGPEDTATHLTFDDEPINPEAMNVLIEQFSTSPTPDIEIQVFKSIYQYILKGDSFGLDSGIDLFFGNMIRDYIKRCESPGKTRKRAFGTALEIPVKTLVVDVLLYENLWQGKEPELVLYDTGAYGGVDPNDPTRNIHRLDHMESIQYLGKGIRKFRISEIPDYSDMLRFVSKKRGWDPEKFRCYRCRIQYPFYPVQVSLLFEPDPCPNGFDLIGLP